MWSPSFKKKVMAAADEVVLLMYQSYRQEPLDYVNWVAYHVETYIKEMEDETDILVSIPDYSSAEFRAQSTDRNDGEGSGWRQKRAAAA